MPKLSPKYRWLGIGHKRKMEIKREERLKRQASPPLYNNRELAIVLAGSAVNFNRGPKYWRKTFKGASNASKVRRTQEANNG